MDDASIGTDSVVSLSRDVVLNHKLMLSYMYMSVGGVECKVFSRKERSEATTRVFEGEEKKAGKMIKFQRNVFVPPVDSISFTISDGRHVWYGNINYENHNVNRKRPTKNETWTEEFFLDTIQNCCQFPQNCPDNISFNFKKSDINRVIFDIRETRKDLVIPYMKPCLLNRVETPSALEFTQQVIEWHTSDICRFVFAGKVKKAKAVVEHGLYDINKFTGERGWCALQLACYKGRKKVVEWLLEEMSADIHLQSADGWTPLHCCCKKGHFEVVKMMLDKGADPNVQEKLGQTPITMLQEGGFVGILRLIIGADCSYTQELNKKHGQRNTAPLEGMFQLLKPYGFGRKHYSDEVSQLLSYGAGKHKKDKDKGHSSVSREGSLSSRASSRQTSPTRKR